MKKTLKPIKLNDFVIRIYKDDIFIGYLKDWRLHRNKKYRFNKTKNINNAIRYCSDIVQNSEGVMRIVKDLDFLHHGGSIKLKCVKVTEQELRKSKLYYLSVIKVREGIFKRVKNENNET